jgi:TrmH family RNA methyltransferase
VTPPRRGPRPPLESPRNPLAARLRRLERDRAERDREGVYLAWGIRLAGEALRARVRVRRALAGSALGLSAAGRTLRRDLERAGIETIETSTRVLEAIAAGSGDQGILLEVDRAAGGAVLLPPGTTLAVIAHAIQDPGNLGSIIRSAWGFGAGAVLALEGCADPFGSRVVRGGMGAHFRIQVVSAGSGPALDAVRAAGLAIVAADPDGSERPHEIDLRRPVAICLGNEAAGLPPALLQRASFRVRVPMRAEVDSLNVHAAAVALLYETWRQREIG